MMKETLVRRKCTPSRKIQQFCPKPKNVPFPKLDRKIIIMSIINITSFVVTLKQLYIDVSWNVIVRIRDPDILFSCSTHTDNKNVLLQESECCKTSVKAGVAKMFASNQLNERYVLCFIIIAGLSAFTLLFIIGGFCVGYRSKHRNILMHPIYSVGTFAHLANCFLFMLGLLLRQKDQSIICNGRGPDKAKYNNKALDCLRQLLHCQDMDMNFKYWFIFSLGWVLIGIVLLVFFYQYSKPFFRGLFTCSSQPHHSESAVHPVSSLDATVIPMVQ